MKKKLLLSPLTALCVGAAFAQASLPIEFPAAAKTMSAAAVKDAVAGKTFRVDLADGTNWRLEYKTNGYFFVNTSGGFNGTGQWRAEDGRLCGQLRGRDPSCNEVRDLEGMLHLKRDSGEVVALKPR